MRLFKFRERHKGWICINLLPDRVDVCHVVAAGRARPEVVLCDSYRKEGGDAETLDRLRRELKLHRHSCTTLLKSGEYRMLQVDALANVTDQEARSAARWRVKDMIDYPVESAAVDAIFIPAPDGTYRGQQMLAVTARDETIAATVKPFHDADIPLQVIDVPELAQRNLAHKLELPGRALALLTLDDRGGLLTFTCDGELYQARRMEISLRNFENVTPEGRSELYSRLVLELQRSLDHFDRQFRHLTVARLMVTPVPGAEEMRKHLAENLDVPVALVHLSEIMDFPHIPELHEEARQAQCLHLIGAAMREEARA